MENSLRGGIRTITQEERGGSGKQNTWYHPCDGVTHMRTWWHHLFHLNSSIYQMTHQHPDSFKEPFSPSLLYILECVYRFWSCAIWAKKSMTHWPYTGPPLAPTGPSVCRLRWPGDTPHTSGYLSTTGWRWGCWWRCAAPVAGWWWIPGLHCPATQLLWQRCMPRSGRWLRLLMVGIETCLPSWSSPRHRGWRCRWT